MPLATSPLRYPGGKTCLLGPISRILRGNKLERGHYAEPYAGGAGLALSLLYGGHVSDIHINDIDPAIWAFWHCVLHDTDAMVDFIQRKPVTIREWRKQRRRKAGGHQHLNQNSICRHNWLQGKRILAR